MSILTTLKEALRKEAHSELIGDDVAVHFPSEQNTAPVCPKKRTKMRLLTLLSDAEQRTLEKGELQSLIRMLREQLHHFQKQEHSLLLQEIKHWSAE